MNGCIKIGHKYHHTKRLVEFDNVSWNVGGLCGDSFIIRTRSQRLTYRQFFYKNMF